MTNLIRPENSRQSVLILTGKAGHVQQIDTRMKVRRISKTAVRGRKVELMTSERLEMGFGSQSNRCQVSLTQASDPRSIERSEHSVPADDYGSQQPRCIQKVTIKLAANCLFDPRQVQENREWKRCVNRSASHRGISGTVQLSGLLS